ncbi:hypothetical protein AMS68_003782 [Peltaster fructicola]|uniref:Uncharacterized protein n=1 Tax=Peltaster fructicola TaxID=286661 RepID=A0A6H0XUE0_9PEZI|nr:hypothetical protein AMS68_003782 [Peltaster fructicola]
MGVRATTRLTSNGHVEDTGVPSLAVIKSILLGSQVLAEGGTAIVQGTTYSLAAQGSALIVNGHSLTAAYIGQTIPVAVQASDTALRGVEGLPLGINVVSRVAAVLAALDFSATSAGYIDDATIPLGARSTIVTLKSASAVGIGSTTVIPGGQPAAVSGPIDSAARSDGGVVIHASVPGIQDSRTLAAAQQGSLKTGTTTSTGERISASGHSALPYQGGGVLSSSSHSVLGYVVVLGVVGLL